MRLSATRATSANQSGGLGNQLFDLAGARPSLDLDFATNKTLQDNISTKTDLITFTRASSGTYVGSDGLIKTATTNEARFDHNPTTRESLGLLVEEQRTNSIRNNTMVGAVAGTPGTNPTNWPYVTTQSNGLTQSIIGTGTENGINYIDYRFNGTTIASPGAVVASFDSGTALTGQTWAGSVFLRLVAGAATGITNTQLGLIETNSSGTFVTGALYTVPTPTSASLISQRSSATRTLVGGATVANCMLTLNINVVGNTAMDFTIRIGMPQLEQGAFATSVIPTTTATVTRSADVASITGANFGTTRTNLLLRSEEFDNASWTKLNSSISANSVAAPNGATTADLLIEDNTNNAHNIIQNAAVVSGSLYAFSVYAKAKERSSLELFGGLGGYGVSVIALFNLQAGTASVTSAGTATSASIQNVGNGWYRCTLVSQATASASPQHQIRLVNGSGANSYTGDGTSGIYLWGAQVETGTSATAYIPTTTAAVSVFDSSWYRQDEGTVFADAKRDFAVPSGPFPRVYQIQGATGTNRVEQSYYLGGQVNFIATNGATQAEWYPAYFIQNGVKSAQALAVNNVAGVSNGVVTGTDTSVTLPTVQLIQIGAETASTNHLNGTIRRLTYWPSRLPNSTLQEITR